MSQPNPNGACIEGGVWTALPNPTPPSITNYLFMPAGSGNMTFHIVGCSGDPKLTGPGLAVAAGMASQIANPGGGTAVAPSFFYHLGDIAYTKSGSDMTGSLWNTQFYKQYSSYADGKTPLPIFAIAGNHDGNTGTAPDTEIGHFLQNMCGTATQVSPDNQTDKRTETAQPYPYWRLDTPLAYIIGLYTNVSNGGLLDDPSVYNSTGLPNTYPQDCGPQFSWLVDQLNYCKEQNAGGTPRAVLLALHYPPYNGALDFEQRGNPTWGNDNAYPDVLPIAMMLEMAYTLSGQIPDAVFSAHAHLYQRLTVNYTDSSGAPIQQVPHMVAGCGGHTQLELMSAVCTPPPATQSSFPAAPFNLFTQGTPPVNLTAPENATVIVESYYDGTNQEYQPYGFLRVTLTPGTATAHPLLVCQFYTTPCNSSGDPVTPGAVVQADSFLLDLATHMLL